MYSDRENHILTNSNWNMGNVIYEMKIIYIYFLDK
jgi:hypothetical protein